jgi:hypothetical protein
VSGILLINVAFSQAGKKPLFKNSYYGFAIGFYPTGQSPAEVKAGDLDNDGDSDLVVVQQNFSNGFVVLINAGKGIYAPSCIATGDLNKNGKIDFVTGQSLSVDVHLNNGTNTLFNAPVTYATSQSPYDILVTDLNNDGNLDIAACTEFNHEGMSVLLGNGNGTQIIMAPTHLI